MNAKSNSKINKIDFQWFKWIALIFNCIGDFISLNEKISAFKNDKKLNR